MAPVSKGDVSAEDYLAEIADLRKRLNEKEQENKYLREQYRAAKRSSEETEGLVKKYETERNELIALREYAYNSEHADDSVAEDKLPDMEEAIADKKIVIIGGHASWQYKLKQMFPDWLFVHPDAFKTVNAGIDHDDADNLCEELGDVLLQLVFMSDIAADKGLFTMGDVIV